MTKDYDGYPLVQKALAEQAVRFKTLPAEMRAATERSLELIENCVTGTHDFKEDLMAMAVLLNCPPFTTLRPDRDFAGDYNAHIAAMALRHMHGQGIDDSHTDLAQVYSALFIAHGENLNKGLKDGKADVHLAQDIREAMEDYVRDRKVYEAAISPALLAVEDKTIAKTFALVDAIITPQSKPKPPKPPATPKPPTR